MGKSYWFYQDLVVSRLIQRLAVIVRNHVIVKKHEVLAPWALQIEIRRSRLDLRLLRYFAILPPLIFMIGK